METIRPAPEQADEAADLAAADLVVGLARVTEAAAIAAARYAGRGDKERIDGVAVAAMRAALAVLPVAGTVVVGEGEKDAAPMLWAGEQVGTGRGTALDVAVDPVDGTGLAADGVPDALSVIAVAPRGTMADLSAAYYMEKLVCGPAARDVVDLDAPIGVTVARVARALGRRPEEITVCALDRPRNQHLVDGARRAGARVRLIRDGDVAASVTAARDGTGIDLLVGIGGAPEAVVTACAMHCLGGVVLGRLAPQDEAERRRCLEAGLDLRRVWSTADLVGSPDVHVAATGITDGDLLPGVRFAPPMVSSTTLALSPHTQRLLHTNRRLGVEPAA